MSASISIIDIFKNDTRFLIHSLLSIYHELSLKQISDLLGKSKSGIHNQIQYMIEGGIVQISREEDCSSDKHRYFYSLTSTSDENTRLIDSKKIDDPKVKTLENIEMNITFSLTKIKLLEHWIKFLELLKESILNNKDSSEAINFMDQLDEELLSTVSFYTKDLGMKFYQKSYDTYFEFEDAAKIEKETDNNQQHPVYASVDIIPIKKMLDYLENQRNLKAQKSNT